MKDAIDGAVDNAKRGRLELGFALGNLVPALVIGLGAYALPVRYAVADGIAALTLSLVVGSSITAVFRPERAFHALRVGALALLAFGLLLMAAAALGVAYLYGVQGPFGRGGLILMTLVLLLAVPYLFGYPVAELLAIHRRLNVPPASQAEPARPATERPGGSEG
jgi:hypothetical protein